MKSKKLLIIIKVILFACTISTAQQTINKNVSDAPKTAVLHVGDKIPARYFDVSQYKDKQINLADFKGKVIMLDMWGTYCASCIEHMPDAENLQKKFRDSLQVIMVTMNSSAQVNQTAKRSENLRNCGLPFINGRDQLAGLFDSDFLPKYIWIDTSGVIRYITNDRFPDDVVKGILSGKSYEVEEKTTLKFASYDIPVMMNLYPVFRNNFYIYSYLAPDDESKYKFNFASRSSINNNFLPKTELGKFEFRDLYKAAYGYEIPENPLPDERVIMKFNDTANYAKKGKKFVYEIIVNKNIPEIRLRKYMQNEFDLFFNVSSHLEKRIVPCLIIKKLNNENKFLSNDKNTNQLDEYGDKMMRVTLPWGKVFQYINFSGMTPPHTVIDETGIALNATVKLDISVDFNDLQKVQKTLALYGLLIVKEDREMDCIVIESN